MTEYSYTLKTTLGDVVLQLPSGADYIYAEFGKAGPMKVFGIAHTGNLRLMRDIEGKWGRATDKSDPYGHHALYVHSRWNGMKHVEASNATRKKLADVLIAEIVAWVEAHPEALRVAAREKLEHDLDKARGEVDTLTKALGEAKSLVRGLERDLAAMGGRDLEVKA